MATVTIKNMQGDNVGTMELSDSIFGIKVNKNAVHMAVVQHLANKRQGTKSTRTRSEVRGGGHKPWRQKGTGRSRQGTIRAPQWAGGGVVFAPKPRDFSFRVNKKLKRLALKSVLTDKLANEKLVVLDKLELPEIKTKGMVEVCANLDLRKALIVIDSPGDENVILSARNIPTIKTAYFNTINVYDILNHESLVVTKGAMDMIQEVYS